MLELVTCSVVANFMILLNPCAKEQNHNVLLISKHLKDLKASDIQDADERRPLPFGPVQSLVDAVDQPAEQPLICCLGQSFNSKVSLRIK